MVPGATEGDLNDSRDCQQPGACQTGVWHINECGKAVCGAVRAGEMSRKSFFLAAGEQPVEAVTDSVAGKEEQRHPFSSSLRGIPD